VGNMGPAWNTCGGDVRRRAIAPVDRDAEERHVTPPSARACFLFVLVVAATVGTLGRMMWLPEAPAAVSRSEQVTEMCFYFGFLRVSRSLARPATRPRGRQLGAGLSGRPDRTGARRRLSPHAGLRSAAPLPVARSSRTRTSVSQ
jgi:hypothetical protein